MMQQLNARAFGSISILAVVMLALLTMPTGWLQLSSSLSWLSSEDKLAHLGGLFCISMLGLFFTRRPAKLRRIIFGLFLAATYLECVQAALPWRVFELADIGANAIGAALALGLSMIILKTYSFFRGGYPVRVAMHSSVTPDRFARDSWSVSPLT